MLSGRGGCGSASCPRGRVAVAGGRGIPAPPLRLASGLSGSRCERSTCFQASVTTNRSSNWIRRPRIRDRIKEDDSVLGLAGPRYGELRQHSRLSWSESDRPACSRRSVPCDHVWGIPPLARRAGGHGCVRLGRQQLPLLSRPSRRSDPPGVRRCFARGGGRLRPIRGTQPASCGSLPVRSSAYAEPVGGACPHSRRSV